jgi:hypothetical protein
MKLNYPVCMENNKQTGCILKGVWKITNKWSCVPLGVSTIASLNSVRHEILSSFIIDPYDNRHMKLYSLCVWNITVKWSCIILGVWEKMKLYSLGCNENNKQMKLYSPGCMDNKRQMKLYYPGCMDNTRQMKLYSTGCMDNKIQMKLISLGV